MASVFGKAISLSVFGESHGPAVGMVLDGIPQGLPVDQEKLQCFVNRRRPRGAGQTARREEDGIRILSGIKNGVTLGTPIAMTTENGDVRSQDYRTDAVPRPGHADYVAALYQDGLLLQPGGGHFSGRLTACLMMAGGVCMQLLDAVNIRVHAKIARIGPVSDTPFDAACPQVPSPETLTYDEARRRQMQEEIAAAHSRGDSVDGDILCFATGLPLGLGAPMMDGLENQIARAVFAIPAVKGIHFGDSALHYGHEYNDAIVISNGRASMATNHCGGILGGMSTGLPLWFTVAIKPTPSIAQSQQSVNLAANEPCLLSTGGRHDACIVPRAVPVCEAVLALVLTDALYQQKEQLWKI